MEGKEKKEEAIHVTLWNSDCQRLSAKLEEIQDEGVNCEVKARSKEKI